MNKTLQLNEKNTLITRAENKKAANFLLAVFMMFTVLTPDLALAGAGGMPWDGALDAILDALNGGVARTIAIIAVIACGVMAFFGKLSADWAVKIVVGFVFVFGAAAIVDFFAGAAA